MDLKYKFIRKNVYLEELDLSGNNLIFDKEIIQNLLHNFKIINFSNVKLVDSNSSFGFFFHSSISQLDLSFTDFKQDYNIFNNFKDLELLKLRQTMS